MVHSIANQIVKRWVKKKIIEDDMYDCYVYGWEIIIITLIEVVNILTLGICTNTLEYAIIFLATFVIVRKYTGGYHANTCFKCNVCLALIFLLNIYITFNYKSDILPLLAVTSVSGLITIYLISPIENINKRLNDDQKKINKKISILLFSLCCIISNLLDKINMHMAITMVVTLIEVLVLMIISQVKIIISKMELDSKKIQTNKEKGYGRKNE